MWPIKAMGKEWRRPKRHTHFRQRWIIVLSWRQRKWYWVLYLRLLLQIWQKENNSIILLCILKLIRYVFFSFHYLLSSHFWYCLAFINVLGSPTIWKCRISNFKHLLFSTGRRSWNNQNKFSKFKIQNLTRPNRWATKDTSLPLNFL